jgi:serine/threonine-protein kinase
MATVYYGRLVGSHGFARTVAIKRLHPHLAKEPEFIAMFVDEARLAARVRHPNVVSTLDVVDADGECFLVMEHIVGETLARLCRVAAADEAMIPPPVAAAIMCGVLHGLHAAHEAANDGGEPLHLVHRDVSPQNILVGADGVPRLIDFGVAKAVGRLRTTGEGRIRGKISYMSPEQLAAEELDRRADIYSAGIVLWELLVGRNLIAHADPVVALREALEQRIVPPRALVPGLPDELDATVVRALARDREKRFATAHQMALALEASVSLASRVEVAEWVKGLAGAVIVERSRVVDAIESGRSNAGRTLPFRREPHGGTTTVARTSGAARRRRWPWVLTTATLCAASATALGWARARRAHHAEPFVSTSMARAAEPNTAAPSPSKTPWSTTSEAQTVAATAPAPPRATGAPRTPRVAPRLPPRAAAPLRADAGCRVEQYVDAEGFTRFRCAP